MNSNVAGRVHKDPIRPAEVRFLVNSVLSTILVTAEQNVRRWVTAVEACAAGDFDLCGTGCDMGLLA